MLGLIIIAIFVGCGNLCRCIRARSNAQHRARERVSASGLGGRQETCGTSGSWEYPLGTDKNGRDVLTRLMYGARVSLVIGIVPTSIVVMIGMVIGLTSGYAGGRTDNLLMRFTDVIYAFPDLLFLIIMMSAFRDTWIGQFLGGMLLLFFALSIINWTGMARLIRGQVLSDQGKGVYRVCTSDWFVAIPHHVPSPLAKYPRTDYCIRNIWYSGCDSR